jgi:para-nitrobenzyl esterase
MFRRALSVFASAGLALLSACTAMPEAPAPATSCPTEATGEDVVITESGAVRGANKTGVRAFLGIPYAAPPVASLRFRAPQPFGCFDGVRDALAFGPACPQNEVDAKGKSIGVSGQEDCLTLNIWAPAGGAPRPVMFFIHGGGNVQGSSSETAADKSLLYDGEALTRDQGAVVVTMNYRIGHLGWTVHDDLAKESPNGVSGNYGLLDQLLALKWVQHNIAAFGGDRSRVLVFGESAGAVNVCNLVASPLAAGLFSAAIAQSGACSARSKEQLATVTSGLLKASKCDGPSPIACLRALSAKDLVTMAPTSANVAAFGNANPGPAIDGHALPQQPIKLLASAHNEVPMVFGVNSEETGKVIGQVPDQATFDAMLAAQTGGDKALATAVAARYPVAEYGGSYRNAFVALTSDAKFVCASRAAARALDQGQTAPVYRYFFTHKLDNSPVAAAFGAFHGLELAFVFHHLGAAGYKASEQEDKLALAMGGYWSRMAATGDPNGAGAVAWPAMDVNDKYLQLDSTIAAGAGIRTKQCDFWDTIYPK